MTDKRWQPPPLENQQTGQQPQVTVDEKVVRKMLAVNPSLRKGRTTQQVKRALERGEAVGAGSETIGVEPRKVAAKAAARDFANRIDGFLTGQGDALTAQLTDFASQRRAVDDEESRAKSLTLAQLVSFLAVLDDDDFAAIDMSILTRHRELFTQLGLTSVSLLDQVRKARKK